MKFRSQQINYSLKLGIKATCRVIKGIACAYTYWINQNPFTSHKRYIKEDYCNINIII